jgi:tRNA dimethylallyltransferase
MNNSDRNNARRLIRKIELVESQKDTIPDESVHQLYDSFNVGLFLPSEILQQKIRERVDARVSGGILEELDRLTAQGYSFDLPSFSSLGYREWKEYHATPSEENKKLAIAAWIHDEIGYTKKQRTWFQKQPAIRWFDSSNPYSLVEISEAVSLWYT